MSFTGMTDKCRGTHWRAWLLAAVCALAAMTAMTAARAARPPGVVEGTVVKVHDGDSLWIKPADKPPIVVRLRDIDAPELCQPHGAEARLALAELALDKKATLQLTGRDAHGRTLGLVVVDGVDVGVRMVEEGHAWSMRSRWDQGPLVKQERMARALSRGLHAAGGAVMPRDFRQSHGPCGTDEPAVAAAAPAAAPRLAAQPALAAPAARASPPPASAWRCDGRTHCSQMRSCEEAKFFLANCPGTHMDGNHDGVPCESQWCGRR